MTWVLVVADSTAGRPSFWFWTSRVAAAVPSGPLVLSSGTAGTGRKDKGMRLARHLLMATKC